MFPKTNLQPGQTGSEVKKLQDFLVQNGYLSQAQVNTGYGTYGPQTTAAVKAFQQANGVDNSSGAGYWGPRSIAAASGTSGSKTQPYSDSEYQKALADHPIIQTYVSKGNTLADLENASSTGDLSGLVNEYGQPFSLQEQKDALDQATKDNELYYKALKEKDSADVESKLAQDQADYQNYLLTSGQNFEQDKTTADQKAADSGVLFSGGRVQKEKNLERTYNQDQSYKAATLGNSMANTARDFQYKYGNSAGNSLSKYYNLGGNTYNANVAQGGVGTNSNLSTVYNPNDYNFQGTTNVEQKAAAAKRAAGLLWNKGNKLQATGYNNQY